MFIIMISFVSERFNEQGVLTFRTTADTWQQANEKGMKKVEQLNNEDSNYTHTLGMVKDFAELEWID